MGILDIAQGAQTQEQQKGSWLPGFVQSTFSSVPEVFGVAPSPEAELFRQEHKWAGIGSELLGTSVPYLGWGKAARAIGPLEHIIQGIGDAEKAPIVTGGLREAARFAPFEAGRAAIASGINGQPFGAQLTQSAVNLGLAGAGGALGGLLDSVGPRVSGGKPLADIAPTVDPNAPLQIRLRQMQEALGSGTTTDPLAAQARLAQMVKESRLQTPGFAQKHLAPLEGDSEDLTRSVERLFFKPTQGNEGNLHTKGALTRLFSSSGGPGSINKGSIGFGTEANWQAAAMEAGLPEDFASKGQFFRFTQARTPKTAKLLQDTASKLTQVNDGLFVGKEAEGNYVVLQKLPDILGAEKTYSRVPTPEQAEVMRRQGWLQKPGKPNEWVHPGRAKDARWVSFKTDDPSVFAKDFKPWTDIQSRWQSWLPPEERLGTGGEVLQAGEAVNKALPLSSWSEARKTGKIEGFLQNATGELGRRAGEAVNHLLTPTINQFSKSDLAHWIWTGTKELYSSAENLVNSAMQGARHATGVQGMLSTVWNGGKVAEGDGLEGLVRGLSDEDFASWIKAWRQAPDKATLDSMLASGQISESAHAAFLQGEGTVNAALESGNATRKLLGEPVSQIREGHGGISRKWDGSLKMGLTDEGGNLVALADADNRAALAKRADFIEQELAKEGILGLKRTEVWDGVSKPPRELAIVKYQPGFLESRSGTRGFKWDFGQTPSKDEWISEFRRNLLSRRLDEAQMAQKALYENHISRLADIDPNTHKILVERVNQLNRIPDTMTRWLDSHIDPILAPALGKGSAGKIVNAVNNGFFHLQRGMGNIAAPVADLMGMFQVMFPEVAFLMHGAPERLAGYYSHQLVQGAKARGVMGVLEPLKVMGKAFSLLAKPPAELNAIYSRAVNEGIIDPKFLEEFAGEHASRVTNLKQALSSPKDFGNFVGALSSWLPSSSERLQRSVAVTASYAMGKDILGLEGEQLFQFIKQFTNRSMYGYATSDKANVLTNPAGRLFGSMKNWVSHYISNMLVYSGEASRGNIAPLAWQMATTGLIGGIAAVPLAPALAGAWSNQVENKKLLPWLYGAVGQKAGDALYLGLPTVMGVSLSSATASPVRDANMLFTFAIADRAKSMAQSLGTGIDYWQATGEHPAKSELARGQFARAFAPKTLYRYLQVYDNPGIQSLSTGYPVIDQVNPWNKVLYTAGFNPNDIERGYAEFEDLLADKNAMQSKLTAYGQAMAQGLSTGDDKLVDNVVQRALVSGVDLSSVIHSANARIDKSSQGMLERNFKQAQLNSYQGVQGRD